MDDDAFAQPHMLLAYVTVRAMGGMPSDTWLYPNYVHAIGDTLLTYGHHAHAIDICGGTDNTTTANNNNY